MRRRRFFNNRERTFFYIAADGKCDGCGDALEDGWHADHVVPWSNGGKTNIFNGRALCAKCNLRKGAKMEINFRTFLRNCSDKLRELRGQVAAWNWAANHDFKSEPSPSLLFELVTGYGKTLLAYGMFDILRQRGIVQQMLVFTPGDDQRSQFAEDSGDAMELLGVATDSWVVDKTAKSLRVLRACSTDVFVATYQQLGDGEFFDNLIEFGDKWLLVLDECHHLPEEGTWAKRVAKLKSQVRVGLSATPVRNDQRALLGLPDKAYITVKYKEAHQEETVKAVRGHIDHYKMKVDADGTPLELTTENIEREMLAAGVKDFSAFEIKRQLRYCTDYIDEMLQKSMSDLVRREMLYPGENQMLGFCMTCRHANHCRDQANSLSRTLGYDLVAEWCGVGTGLNGTVRSEDENRLIKKIFRKGFRSLDAQEQHRARSIGLPDRIDILFQVGMAEEGFSTKKVSVIAFLHLLKSEPKLLQQIGRGLRRNEKLPHRDDTCSIYASADTKIGELIKKMEADSKGSWDEKSPDKPENGFMRLDELMLFEATFDRTDTVFPDGIDAMPEPIRNFCQEYNCTHESLLDLMAKLGQQHLVSVRPATPHRNTQAELKRVEEHVKTNTRKLCNNIFEIARDIGMAEESDRKPMGGPITRSINAEWVRLNHGNGHKAMTPAEFQAKNKWLLKEDAKIREERRIPQWVTLS